MTTARQPGNTEFVLFHVLRDMSDNEIERATGKKRNSLSKASNPNDDDRHLSLDDAIGLDVAMIMRGDAPRFFPHMQQAIEIATGAPASRGIALTDAVHALTVQTLEVNVATQSAMEDGKLSPAERRGISKELHDVIDAAKAALEAIEPPASLKEVK